jgi:hypothetical protein
MKKNLDCHAPKGRQWIEKQNAIAHRVAERFGHDVVFTPDTDAKVDCIFTKDNVIVGIAEIKSRDLKLDQLRRMGTYLVTEEKLLSGIEIAKYFRAPFALIINLKDADIFIKICNAEGDRLVSWKSDLTRTQATCNGGQADRQNAYVSLSTMLVLR